MTDERLTLDGGDGIRAFCSSCSDKPLIGKCDIGNECYHRQVFKKLREYEQQRRAPSEEVQRAIKWLETTRNDFKLMMGDYKKEEDKQELKDYIRHIDVIIPALRQTQGKE